MEFFSTTGANPVSMAIAKEVLTVIEKEKFREHANEVGDYLQTELNKLKEKHE